MALVIFFVIFSQPKKKVHRWQVGVLEIVCLLAYNSFIILGLFRAGKPQGMGAPKSMWCIWPVVGGERDGFRDAVSTVKRLAPWWPKWRRIIKTWRILMGEDESSCFEWIIWMDRLHSPDCWKAILFSVPWVCQDWASISHRMTRMTKKPICDPWDERYIYLHLPQIEGKSR